MRPLILILAFSALTYAQKPLTARDYFNEQKKAGGFTHVNEKYVCFYDDDTPYFAVIASFDDIFQRVTLTRGLNTAKKLEAQLGSFKNGLYVHTYRNGVLKQQAIYEKTDHGYELESGAPLHGKMVYRINWSTGRFTLELYAPDHDKNAPASQISGKCELIDPDDSPSVLAGR
jgi:hypothetical protein